MQLFHLIDDGVAILRVKGQVYRQVKIYRRGADVFAAIAGGFVKLVRGGGTTKPDISWLEVEGPGVEVAGNLPKFVDAEALKAVA